MHNPLDGDVYFQIDFPDCTGAAKRRVFRDPVELLTAESLDQVAGIVERAEEAARRGLTAVGYIAYEAAPAFDSALTVKAPGEMPLAVFGLFDKESESSQELDSGSIASPSPSRAMGMAPRMDSGSGISADWRGDTAPEEYSRLIAEVHDAIARGRTYQVNLTLRLHAPFAEDPLAYYGQLCATQQAAYCGYLSFGPYRILSVSPELFFLLDGNRIVTRPVKGTAPRGADAVEDLRLAAELLHSEKNRAENLMIVDLLRNDLGRLACYGSVHVEELFTLEGYPTFQQLASQISARIPPQTKLIDILRALFPCGSVTGAPKRSTMEYIAALENSPRGPYCGTIGLIEPVGRSTFSVAIRTTTIDVERGEAVTGVGSGVTWDSNADDEYAEIAVKSRYLGGNAGDWSLLETLLLRDGKYTLLDEHMERLADSARFFRFDFRPEEIRNRLQETAERTEGPRRVRLIVDSYGRTRVEPHPLDELPEHPRAVLSANPVPSDCLWLKHKTTRRELYEERLREHPGVFDVLLINERGELTEFTRGNLVVELEGVRLTPPLECGLLDGTMRRKLVRQGEIDERVLRTEDLKRASHVWFINSVRGWVVVEMEIRTSGRDSVSGSAQSYSSPLAGEAG